MSTNNKPNILFLVADQFRADTLGCLGHPDIQTPNYDALAADGTIFTNAYSPNPVCVPARASMITGNYPHKCLHNPDNPKSNSGEIKEDQIKLPQLLAENGYKTYSAGKLHYLPYTDANQEHTLHGFQKAALAESGRILKQYDPKNEKRNVEEYMDYVEDVGWKGFSRAHGIGNNDIHPAPSPLPQEHCVDAWVATKTIEYLDEHLNDSPDKPFMMHASFPKPHSPYDPPRPYDQMYDPKTIQKPAINKDGKPRSPHMVVNSITHGIDLLSPEAYLVARAHYYGLISFQDKQVGKIIDYLKSKDLYENTIIVFMADHGDMMGDFGFFFKSNMHEGSVKIPMIISWPDKLPKSQVNHSLVGLQDIVPTITALVDIPLTKNVDGENLKETIETNQNDLRETIVSYSMEHPNQNYMIRDHTWKYIYSEANGVEELYNLNDDPREETNLIDKERSIADNFKARLIEWTIENKEDKILSNGKLVKTALDLSQIKFMEKSMGWRWY
ncbi:MAG: hypothetical protein COA79_11945 [Planctomycetota bacterium]|nr:MAG: hypothetical protein COA79_11945 [Planctomycetota bacterium]